MEKREKHQKVREGFTTAKPLVLGRRLRIGCGCGGGGGWGVCRRLLVSKGFYRAVRKKKEGGKKTKYERWNFEYEHGGGEKTVRRKPEQ